MKSPVRFQPRRGFSFMGVRKRKRSEGVPTLRAESERASDEVAFFFRLHERGEQSPTRRHEHVPTRESAEGAGNVSLTVQNVLKILLRLTM